MNITASLHNDPATNNITVTTNDVSKTISIPGKPTGGSSVNGAELLFLALATCFCNDIYREALKRNMRIESVDVSVSGQFGKEGETGKNITYTARVVAPGESPETIRELVQYVDSIAEIHNTMRKGTAIVLNSNKD